MMDYEYLKQATDEQLMRWMKERQGDVKELERQIERLQTGIAAHQGEIDRRAYLEQQGGEG